MLGKPLDAIAAADITQLVEQHVREVRSIDYKRSLPGGRDAEMKEFLADVASFANGGGGDIIFGVAEQRDGDGRASGIPDRIVGLGDANMDAEIRRLENIIRDGIAPRIAGVCLRAVEIADVGSVLVLRAPQSWGAPHMVTFKGTSRFFSRNSAGKYQLDVTEIRAAFLASEGQGTRIARFRDERLAKIVGDDTPVRLSGRGKAIMHVFPAVALNSAFAIDVQEVAGKHANLPPLGSSGFNNKFNFDGLVTYSGREDAGDCRAYLQLFRSGVIETVDSSLLVGEGSDRVPSEAYEKDLIETLRNLVRFYPEIGVEPPLFVFIGLVGMKGCRMAVSRRRLGGRDSSAFDRDALLPPEVVVDSFTADLSSLLRPAFDTLWQAAGWARSFNYDSAGKWIGQS